MPGRGEMALAGRGKFSGAVSRGEMDLGERFLGFGSDRASRLR